MKKGLRYFFLGFLILVSGCSPNQGLDKRVRLWRLDKIPYDTKYAFDHLPLIFPKAEIRTGSRFPVLFQNNNEKDTIQALIIIGPLFAPDPDEMRSLLRFAANGNQVFISCLEIDDSALSLMHLKQSPIQSVFKDSGKVSILNPSSGQWIKYNYPGFSQDTYFSEIDTGYTMVIGKNSEGRADFVRMAYDHGGSVYVHLDPFAFTNFFLLHKENKTYYDLALSYMSGETGIVQWSDYFRYRREQQTQSSFHFLLSKKSFRWAFWITILLLGIVLLFESKPRQRPVPEIPAIRNASEDFVKTVGQLYFQQKNNQNLALKMISSFLENIRAAYSLSTSSLNEEFTRKLSFRTGKSVSEVAAVIQTIYDTRLKTEMSDQELMDLHTQISQFFKPVNNG